MGGLVAKKAYLLAKQSKEYERFSRHVQHMFFLATPHRGSNLAELLSRILQVSLGPRPFVADLQPNSATIQAINDEFPRFCQGLNLFSFYETLPMTIGLQRKMVVPKESATLGYVNERTMYLGANHREVCKFENIEEPNYRAVRNALAGAFSSFRSKIGLKRKAKNFEQQQSINESLNISDSPEDDYIRADAVRVPGSCEWINSEPVFQRWRDEGRPQLYWQTAKPGAGKSVLTAYVLKSLRDMDKDCGFFFFAHAEKLKSTMGRFFCFMAWQMAAANMAIFDALSKICQRDPRLAQADYRTIWRKLFLECIFKHPTSQPQYWIVDALDECKADNELVSYLLQAANTGFIRVYLTSRTTLDSYGLPLTSPVEVHVDTISQETTQADITLYLEANSHNLPGINRHTTTKLLLQKSSGCFLWVRLVVQELRRVSTRAGIQQVLEETPADMDHIYNRIINSILTRAREKTMILAILYWTACAARPLTTSELYHALRLDMEDEIDDDIRRFIDNNCGQLVVVDPDKRVRMIHLTARDFLFSAKNTSAVQLDRRVGHKRISMVCLKYLCGPEMAGPKPRKLSAAQLVTERCDFAAYACDYLPQHLLFVSSGDDDFAASLVRFLKSSNLLSWIEYVARNSDLNPLIQMGTALRKYLQKRTKTTIPLGKLGKEIEIMDAWATDLIRLVTKFGSKLRASPSIIFNLVAPFCPPNSAMRSQHASSNRSISVNGLSMQDWDDCTSTIRLAASPKAIACSTTIFAVGMQDGNITILSEATCQELRTIRHGEPVKKLLFGDFGNILVSGGLQKICIWNSDSWEMHWAFDLHSQFISLALADEDKLLLVTYRSNELIVWDLATRMAQDTLSWLDEYEAEVSNHFRRPSTTAISGDRTHLAYAYRGQDIVVWHIENGCVHDVYGKDEGSLGASAERRTGIASALSMIFSRAPESKLLAVGYNDGVLSLFNIAEGAVQAKTTANGHTLASSADGLTLACGNSAGTICIFEFDSLKLLHKIQAEESIIKQLAFSANGHRLLDIQGSHCRVWDPPVLVLQDIDEVGSNNNTVSVSTSPVDVGIDEEQDAAHISSIACDHTGSIILCGKENGDVCLYDSSSGLEQQVLLRHAPGTPISLLLFDVKASILVSCDYSSRVTVHKLGLEAAKWALVNQMMDIRVGIAVNQILINNGGTRLLISTADYDILWGIMPGHLQQLAQLNRSDDHKTHRWSLHPCRDEQLMLISGTEVRFYEWTQLQQVTMDGHINLVTEHPSELDVKSIQPCFNNKHLATMITDSSKVRSGSRLMFWDAQELATVTEVLKPVEYIQPLADQVQHFIGLHYHRVVFLHDDGWICSADAQSFHEENYDRHFFLPVDWLTKARGLQIEVLRNGTILFVIGDQLAIIKRGLEHFEHGHSKGLGKRPTISRSVLSNPTDANLRRSMSLAP